MAADPYGDVEHLMARHGITGTAADGHRHRNDYSSSLAAATDTIHAVTGRTFRPAEDRTEARYFKARPDGSACQIDDIEGAFDVAVGSAGQSGTFTAYSGDVLTSKAVTGYGVVDTIHADGVLGFPSGVRCYVRVTPSGDGWGWTEPPDAIVEACYLEAARLFKSRDATLDTGGFDAIGVYDIGRHIDPVALGLMKRFRRVEAVTA